MYTKYILIFLMALGSISTILAINKKRKPTTPGLAVVTLIMDALLIVGLLLNF